MAEAIKGYINIAGPKLLDVIRQYQDHLLETEKLNLLKRYKSDYWDNSDFHRMGCMPSLPSRMEVVEKCVPTLAHMLELSLTSVNHQKTTVTNNNKIRQDTGLSYFANHEFSTTEEQMLFYREKLTADQRSLWAEHERLAYRTSRIKSIAVALCETVAAINSNAVSPATIQVGVICRLCNLSEAG